MNTRVLLVDDHELIRQGLVRAFERNSDMQVVGQAGGVHEGLTVYQSLQPDVLVTDLKMPDGTGFDLAKAVRAENETVGIVMLTMHAGDDQIFAAMEAGVSAFVSKESKSTEVVNAARHAAVSPRTFLCSGLSAAMMRRATAPKVPQLSAREKEVLKLLAEGLGTGEIARRLYMSESTTKTHISHIYEKLGATNRAQALVTAMREGLLSEVSTRQF